MPATPQDRALDVAGTRLVASSIAHAVRTPLHSLLGFGELLAMTDLDRDQRRLVEQMVDGADHLLISCDRLALLLRLLTGDERRAPERFDLTEMLGEVTATANPTGTVAVRVHPQIPASLVGDVEALRHLLIELVVNAGTHGSRLTGVTVDVGGPASEDTLPVRFRVSDAGPGLPDAHLAGLNADVSELPADARQLGLYLVRRLADRLGGQLSAAHSAAGGTEVALRVVLRPAPRTSTAATVARRVEMVPRALRVLLVEDNSVNRILTQKQLTKLGHHLDAVTNGQDGVTAALTGQYDVVLMDRHLPDLDGVEATQRIRAAEADLASGRRIPIVAVTADAIAGHREECLAAGMDGFLTKPVDIEHLRAALVAFTPAPDRAEPGDLEVDPDALDRLSAEVDGDAETVAEMIRAYLTELPGRRLRLQISIRRSSTRQTVAAAESLRAASVMIGAVGIARACARIVDAAKQDDFRTGHDALPELLDVCQRTVDVLAPMSEVAVG
jgi:CheY-like chemotaxis protein/HPt (histidine-containing phosphotransfer) domain-containing protein/anti-sigma regulatory factor (Ser/Thr protein kinase)